MIKEVEFTQERALGLKNALTIGKTFDIVSAYNKMIHYYIDSNRRGEQFMNELEKHSDIWEKDKEKYVLVDDEFGTGIFYIQGKQIMFVLIEDDALHDLIVCKMIECGNKKYSSLAELQAAVDV